MLLDVEPVGSLTAVEFRYDEYVRGSGAALPFADAAFDIVCAHDTLEHIPQPHRAAFLGEVFRVAKRLVLINGPLDTEGVARAEARLDSFVKTTLHWEQPFLQEHIALGLPGRELIEDDLARRERPFVRVANGNLTRWLVVQALRHYLAALPDSESLREELDRAYNTLVPVPDAGAVCYRQAYVIPVGAGAREVLARVREEFPEAPGQAVADIEGLSELLAAFESHAGSVREQMAALHKRIFDAEKAAVDAKGSRDELAAIVTARDAQVLEQQQAINDIENRLRHATRELEAVKRSLPYRAVRGARNAVRDVMKRGKKPR